ncbi:MAG: sodium-dependent transporter [Pseudomonadales bacterium]|nr:sodium-dependent transporter [Pseudomonadales bacterium]
MAYTSSKQAAKLKQSRQGMWSSRWLFVLAAAGSAVGLGNIWKFPYIAGENGGGAFVVVYLGCVLLVGIPIMIAEVMLGRAGRGSPVHALRNLIESAKASSFWRVIGWLGIGAGFLILSYYSVIAGWALFYIWQMGSGVLVAVTPDQAGKLFSNFLSDPFQLVFWHTLFMALVVWIVSKGVVKGLENAVRICMPLLFLLLVVLLVYSAQSGGFEQAFNFMFSFNWSEMHLDGFLVALGQAFFTLSLAMGAIMAYGAYVSEETPIISTITTVAIIDTSVAIASGLAIFPIVFANGLDPSSGPGLMFVTLPLAFGQMPGGMVFGALFFLLVSFAAITSAISLLEPLLAYLVEEYNAKRKRVAVSMGVLCWTVGLGSVLSFNVWAEFYIVGDKTFFDFVDYVTQNIMLPLGGVLIALFAAFVVPKEVVAEQLGLRGGFVSIIWNLLIKLIAPLGVLAVFCYTIYTTLYLPMTA